MQHREDLIETIENEYGIIGKRHDGIIHVYYFPELEVDLNVQAEMLNVFLKITESKPHAFLFEAGNYVTVTKEARDNAIKMEMKTPVRATVVLVKNSMHKLLADFYYKVNKPVFPYKVSRDFEQSIFWLKERQSEMNTEEIIGK